MVVFPGAFGSRDELGEIVMLSHTSKIARPLPVLLFGPSSWEGIIYFEALLWHAMISAQDFDRFCSVDIPAEPLARTF